MAARIDDLMVLGQNISKTDLAKYLRDRELILISCEPDHNVIRFIPPLITTRDELDWSIDLIDQALSDWESR